MEKTMKNSTAKKILPEHVLEDGWIAAPLPDNERERLEALQRYNILDTLPEAAFDRITRLASVVLKTPISLVSLVDGDRQWFKSHYGIDATETPRDMAFCAHTILQDEVMVVPNATKDRRFSGNPLVTESPDIRFYAGAPLATADGYNIGTLCVIDRKERIDVSPEDKALLADLAALVIDELELRVAERKAVLANEAKSKFLANMSHEIRTPMNAVIGFVRILMDTHLTEAQQELAKTIRSSSEALLDVINDILDISKIEAGKLSIEHIPFNLRIIVSEIRSLFMHKSMEKGVSFTVSVEDNVPEGFSGDPSRIRQVLMNLVSNAIKFTDAGTVKLSVSFDREILRFCVQDSGIGIRQENIDKIFEDFTQEDMSITRRYGGTGLGLPICRQLVSLMGGALEVSSAYGKGSEFAFTLPLPVAEVAVLSMIQNQDGMLAINARILVVEDLLFNQKIVRYMLEKVGCTVDVADSGTTALEAVQRADYDIIFMDIQMPEMDGRETTRRLRKTEGGKRNTIIAMTASALDSERAACHECGMDDFISKPLQEEELYNMLQKHVVHV